jgi:hypothetical protein
MIKNYSIIILLVGSFFFQQCGNKKQTGNEAGDTTVSEQSSANSMNANVAMTGRLAALGLTLDSDWRGINLGDDFAKVKTTEKAELFERDDKHAGYTVEFKNLESADILYYQTNQKVSSIEVDLFLNNRESVGECQRELGSYFDARYGPAKAANGVTTWTSKDDHQITLKDVSKGKDFGLKIKIGSAGGVMTASAK